jgi:hypothetical protein
MKHEPIGRSMPRLALRRPPVGLADMAGLRADHARLHAACDRLEQATDGVAAQAVRDALVAHLRTTCALFDRMFRGERAPAIRGMLSRILSRQMADTLLADDLGDALLPEGGDAALVEELAGHLVERCRRALEGEALFLLSLGRDRLTGEARAAIAGIV